MPGGESMRASGIGTWLAGAACFALGSFAGAWGGAMLAESPRAAALEADGGGEALGTDELARAVMELRAAVAELAAAAGRLAETDRASAARVPAPAANGGDELAEAVRQLSAAVESLRDRGDAGAPSKMPEPGSVDRAAAIDLRGLRQAKSGPDRAHFDRVLDAFRARHLLWSSEDAVRSYGKPDRIRMVDGCQLWNYRVQLAEGGTDELSFLFENGLLVEVYY